LHLHQINREQKERGNKAYDCKILLAKKTERTYKQCWGEKIFYLFIDIYNIDFEMMVEKRVNISILFFVEKKVLKLFPVLSSSLVAQGQSIYEQETWMMHETGNEITADAYTTKIHFQ
jgi:hypothetical protein